MPAGRPSKLTPELQKEICGYIEDNWAPAELACEAAGITARVYYLWMQQGQQEETGPHFEFFHAVTRAKARARLEQLASAKAGDDKGESNGRSKCSQWFLERLDRRFSPRVTVKVQEELESLLDVVERVCSSKDCGCYAQVLAALAARAGGEEAAIDPGEPAGSVH